ncbi:MAG: AAA family ATPase, partial [Prevotella sp.]|nr:AAA family ATPase [Prevotella sp.]
MIIKKVTIKNFRSYYGENTFEFSDGLTLIIGDNGDGKTTFFEALQWLLDTTKDNNSIENVSEMCKSQMTVGDSEELKISMVFEHAGEKSIEKSYSFEKKSDNYFNTSRINFRGYESNGTERISVDGKILIDRCFDAFMQRFSMFKGESNLNVFNSETALKDLVDKFSDIRKFDNLVEITKTMEEKSNAAFIKECKSDKKISAKADELGTEIQCVIEDINNKKKEIREKQKTVSTFSSNLEKLEKNQDAVEKYQEVSDRLKNLSDKALKLKGMIGAIDKDTALLDRLWILCAFPPVFSEFTKKSSALSKEKRIQEKKFDEQQGIKRGKLETLKEIRNALSNGAAELPWYLPDQQNMEEMIKDHICKVCGREA